VFGLYDTQHNDIQQSDTQHKVPICDTRLKNTVIILSVAFYYYAECHYVECRYAECRYAEYC
jgi:hypothetical protein